MCGAVEGDLRRLQLGDLRDEPAVLTGRSAWLYGWLRPPQSRPVDWAKVFCVNFHRDVAHGVVGHCLFCRLHGHVFHDPQCCSLLRYGCVHVLHEALELAAFGPGVAASMWA